MTIRLREMIDEEVETIHRWANSRTAEAQLVERAKVIRVAREGKRGKAVAEKLGLNPATVRKWLKRFNETGLAGLQDVERPGKPLRYTPEQVGEVLATALTNPSILGLPFARWTLGCLEAYLNEATSFRLLDQYLDAGGSFLDTANSYACWVNGFQGGESETLLGQWMRQRKHRSRIFLASKVGFAYPGTEAGASAGQIERECEKSLQRLGVETIDLYYIHLDDRTTPLEESLGALNRLVNAGKVRYFGASHFLAWRLEEAFRISQNNGWGRFCCIQQCHTYLRPRPGTAKTSDPFINDDLLDYARNRPITLLAYNALLSGAYTRPEHAIPDQYLGPDTDARLATLRKVAAEKNASPNQIVLSWMVHSSPGIIPLIGASTSEQLAENLQALEVHLSTEEMTSWTRRAMKLVNTC